MRFAPETRCGRATPLRRSRWLGALRPQILVALPVLIGLTAPAGAIPAGDRRERRDHHEESDIRRSPGYVDFDAIGLLGREALKTDLTLTGDLLEAAANSADEDADLKELSAKIKQIRIQSFEMDETLARKAHERLEDLSDRLKDKGWEPLLRARKEGTETSIYLKWQGGAVEGFVLMSVDPKHKATFVNIVGEIDGAQLNDLGSKLHIESLDKIDMKLDFKTPHADPDKKPNRDR